MKKSVFHFVRIAMFLVVFVAYVGAADAAKPVRGEDTLRFDAATRFSVSELHSPQIGQRVSLQGVTLEGRPDAVELALKRVQVFSDDAQIVVHSDDGEQVFGPPDNAYFIGTISGVERTRVFLVARGNRGVRGMVAADGLVWQLEGDGSQGTWSFRKLDEDLLKAGDRSFACDSDSISREIGGLENFAGLEPDLIFPPAAATKATASYTARVGVETDYEFYQIFGNATDATDYVGDLIGYASGIYSDEVDTSLIVSHLSLWSTSSDPWDENSTICGLMEFGQYWNYNHTGVERSVAHFMSGRNLGGGIAWTGVLCMDSFNPSSWGYTPSAFGCSTLTPESDIYGGAYGFTASINGGFNAASPSPVWDIISVSHEIGHNFSSPHTHCYENVGGNASAVDECYSGQCGTSGCFCGSPGLPGSCPGPGNGCGTVMSYCHLQSGSYANISLTFGEGHPYGVAPERVPAKMYSHVLSAASSSPSCLAYEDTNSVFDDGFESNNTNAWDDTVQ